MGRGDFLEGFGGEFCRRGELRRKSERVYKIRRWNFDVFFVFGGFSLEGLLVSVRWCF